MFSAFFFLPVGPSFHTSISPCEDRCWTTIGWVRHRWRPCGIWAVSAAAGRVECDSTGFGMRHLQRGFDSLLGVCLFLSVTEKVPYFASGTRFWGAVKVDWNPVQDMTDWRCWQVFQFLTDGCSSLSRCSRLIESFSVKICNLNIFNIKSLNPSIQPTLFLLSFTSGSPSLHFYPTISFSLTIFPSFHYSFFFGLFAPPYNTVQQRQRSVPSGWSRAPPESRRRNLSLRSHASWQNRACRAHAASRSHPSSFSVHLHLNSARLRMPKQLTSQQSAERGDTRRLLISAIVPFSSVLRGEALMWAQRDSECLREPYNSNYRYKTLIGCINPMIVT